MQLDIQGAAAIANLNRDLVRHQALSGKTTQEVLQKQGGNLALFLYKALKEIRPEKGSIRKALLDRLKSGQGVHIRQASYLWAAAELADSKSNPDRKTARRNGKKLNLTALALKREIASRESGSGFLSVSAMYPRTLGEGETLARSRAGDWLSHARAAFTGQEGSVTFTWDGNSGLAQNALAGVSKSKGQAALAKGIQAAHANMTEYIVRKYTEALKKAIGQ